jgi:hypothetical protein
MAVFGAVGRILRRALTWSTARLFDVVFFALSSSRGRAAVIDCAENKGPLCCRQAASTPCFFALRADSAEQWAQSAVLSVINYILPIFCFAVLGGKPKPSTLNPKLVAHFTQRCERCRFRPCSLSGCGSFICTILLRWRGEGSSESAVAPCFKSFAMARVRLILPLSINVSYSGKQIFTESDPM